MAKKRKPIGTAVSADLLWQAGHTCCLCPPRRDVQFHHFDGNPADNSPENLILLCPNCHSEVERTGGFGRRFTKTELRKYRDEWFAQVRDRRRYVASTQSNDEFTAIAAFDVRRMCYEIEVARANWSVLEDKLLKLIPYARDFGYRVKSEVAYAASIASDGAWQGMTVDVTRALQTVLLEILPIGFGGLRAPLHRKVSKHEEELARRVISTARGVTWDACRYLRNPEVLEEATYVLFAALRFARLNKLNKIEGEALEAFNACAAICDETRNDVTFPEGRTILKHWLEEAQSED